MTKVELNGRLLNAAANENLTDLKKWLMFGADVNATDNYGWTALMYAARNYSTKIVAALLKHPDIDVTIKNSRGNTALGLVHNSSRHEIIHMLRNYLDYR